jgi:NifU-like protein involved in Fe-S cluster formation
MTIVVQGCGLAEVRSWARCFPEALEGTDDILPPGLEPLQPLLELRNHRSRIGCALLPWTALKRALDGIQVG